MAEVVKQLAPIVGGIVAIGLGVALIWFPPATIASDGGTFLTAGAFITGGLAAFQVTVTLPAVRSAAREEARRSLEAAGSPRTARTRIED